MEFARKELKKYGWSEGQGLGKNSDGISKPLKPKIKLNQDGLGYDRSEEFNDKWWHRWYDEAANNIIAKGNALETVDENFEINSKRRKKKRTGRGSDAEGAVYYKDFVKVSELSGDREKKLHDDATVEEDVDERERLATELSDEKCFKACGGKTGHKGARHGLKMNAKLARLGEQESSFAEIPLNRDGKFNEIKEIKCKRTRRRDKV